MSRFDAPVRRHGRSGPFRRFPATLLRIHGRRAGRRERRSGMLPKMAQGDERHSRADYGHGTLHRSRRPATTRLRSSNGSKSWASDVLRPMRRPSRRSSTAGTWSSRTRRARSATTCNLRSTGGKIAEKTLSENLRQGEEPPLSRPISAWWSTTTSKRSSSRSWTTTSRPTSKRSSTASPTATSPGTSMIDDFYGPFHKMVDHRPSTRRPTKTQPGAHPGHRSQDGAYRSRPASAATVRWSRSKANEGEKSRFASLKKGQLIESHHARRGVGALRAAPRPGPAATARSWSSASESSGPTCGTANRSHRSPRTRRSLHDRLRPRCGARARTAGRAPLRRTLRSKPSPKSPNMLVKNGRYGALHRLQRQELPHCPKGTKPEELTLDDVS